MMPQHVDLSMEPLLSLSSWKSTSYDKHEANIRDGKLLRYFLVKANIMNALPSFDFGCYDGFYRRYMRRHGVTSQEAICWMEHRMPFVRDGFDVDPQQPKIYCTYHVGAFKTLSGYLVSKGVSFVHIIETNVQRRNLKVLRELLALAKGSYGGTSETLIINGEEASAMLSIYKKIKQGYSVVVFIDGNTGVGGVYRRGFAGQLRLPFFAQQLIVRQGIATLAQKCRINIKPVVSLRQYADKDHYRILLKGFEEIDWTRDPSEITKALYKILEATVQDAVHEWEGWVYLHKYLCFDRDRTQRQLLLDEPIDFDRVGFFQRGGRCYVIDLKSYLFYPIDEALFVRIRNSFVQSIEKQTHHGE